MPTYTFECGDCGYREDRVLRISEADQSQRCKVEVGLNNLQPCNGEMKKVWNGTAPGVTFKGRGWTPRHYNTGGRR